MNVGGIAKREYQLENESTTKDRLAVLREINILQNSYCKSCPVREHKVCLQDCDIGFNFSSLGDLLIEISRREAEKLIMNSKELSKDDVQFLINRGYSPEELKKRLNLEKEEEAELFYGIRKQI